MIGIELAKPCGGLVKEALDQGLLINVTTEKVVRLLPALVMRQDEAEQVVDQVCALIKEFLQIEVVS
jgi:acetylornithine aminotransferase